MAIAAQVAISQEQSRPYNGSDNHAHHVDDGSHNSHTSGSSSPVRSRSPASQEAYAMAIDQDHRRPQELPINKDAPVDNLTYNDEVWSQHKKYYWLQTLGQVCQEVFRVSSLLLRTRTNKGFAF
jgi:hypothetical protein